MDQRPGQRDSVPDQRRSVDHVLRRQCEARQDSALRPELAEHHERQCRRGGSRPDQRSRLRQDRITDDTRSRSDACAGGCEHPREQSRGAGDAGSAQRVGADRRGPKPHRWRCGRQPARAGVPRPADVLRRYFRMDLCRPLWRGIAQPAGDLLEFVRPGLLLQLRLDLGPWTLLRVRERRSAGLRRTRDGARRELQRAHSHPQACQRRWSLQLRRLRLAVRRVRSSQPRDDRRLADR